MKNIEIPLQSEKSKRYRFFEMLPALLTYSLILLPVFLSIFAPVYAAYFIIGYMIIWLFKAVAMSVRVVQGYQQIQRYQRYDWERLLSDVASPDAAREALQRYKNDKGMQWHYRNLSLQEGQLEAIDPKDLIHAVIIPTYNEGIDVLEPTIESVLASNFPMKQVIFILAYEERGGVQVERNAKALVDKYRDRFMEAFAVKHPDGMANEVIGKGGNATYAGKFLAQYVADQAIAPSRVIVTTLDSDNRPHPGYLAALSYAYVIHDDPVHTTFQPVPLYTNNIWDAPAPMRVIATGNSFWMVITSLRPHLLRNFSSHAQSLQALIDTDFWSVRTIVEDGHQFWRTYFRYDGQHDVVPLFIPIYQDAVLASGYVKTLREQFIQLRRWAWGASDVAYVLEKGYFQKNKVPKFDLTMKLARLIEGHVSWATAPLILAFAAWLPLFVNPHADRSFLAHQLPVVASRIQTVAMFGVFITMFLSLKLLPPMPARYKARRRVYMVLQWVYMPVTSIVYTAFSALNSQTRLLFGRYLDKFDVTEKAVKK